MELERCCDCDEPTGRSGQAEDSLYTPEGRGPWCPACWDDGTALDSALARAEQKERSPGNIQQHHVADAFWKSWAINGEPHKHGYYESTWMAIHAALDAARGETGE